MISDKYNRELCYEDYILYKRDVLTLGKIVRIVIQKKSYIVATAYVNERKVNVNLRNFKNIEMVSDYTAKSMFPTEFYIINGIYND